MQNCCIFVLIHLSCFILNFTAHGLRAETVRGRIDPAAAARKTAYSLSGFGPQTADTSRTELADGVSKIGGSARFALRVDEANSLYLMIN
jgi:hypothetical protein